MTGHTRTDGMPEPGQDGVLQADGGAADAAAAATAPAQPGDATLPAIGLRARPRNERMAAGKVECNACPVLCQISPGRSGACDRYANQDGRLIRVDPVVLLRRTLDQPDPVVVPFSPREVEAGTDGAPAATRPAATAAPVTGPAAGAPDHGVARDAAEPGSDPQSAGGRWNGDLLRADEVFVTGIGSSTTYPDYKPAPFIVASRHEG